MDTGNGSKAVFTDAVGKPMSRPSAAAHLASPINLLNPDRYEFYTFDDSGDLVKRLMTLKEIQQIIANGDSDGISTNSDAIVEYSPEKKVDDVVNNVQNVLKEEIEKNSDRPVMNDLSSSWTMVLPAVFGNSGEEVVPDGTLIVATPETIMIEPTSVVLTTNKQESNSEVTTNGLMLDSKPEKENNLVSNTSPTSDMMINNEESIKNTTVLSDISTNPPLERISTFIPIFSSSTAPKPSNTITVSSTVTPEKSSTIPPSQSSSLVADNQKLVTKDGLTAIPTSTTFTSEVERQTTTELVIDQNDLPILKENVESLSAVLLNESKNKTIEKIQPAVNNPHNSPSDYETSTKLSNTYITTTQKQLETSPIFKVTTTSATELTSPTTISSNNSQQQLNAESTKIPMSAEEFPSSTYSFLTTFFGMNTIQNSSSINPQISDTTTIINDISFPQQQSTERPSTIDALDIEKLAVTELLDQLLLSSTSLYQLNPELAQDAQKPTIESKTESETTLEPEVTTKIEQNIISSIEQLLSQAITTDVEESAENSTTLQGEKVHDFMLNMGEKNMSEVQEQTATVMSSLMGNLDVDLIKQQNEDITYRNTFKNVSVATEIPPVLDDSVDTFISQVVLEEVLNATTIADDLPAVASTTQKSDVTVEVLLPKTEEEIDLNVLSTTSESENFSTIKDDLSTEFSTQESSNTEATFQITSTAENELQETSTTTIEKVDSKTEESDLSTTTDFLTTKIQKQTTVKLEEDFISTTTADFTTNPTVQTTVTSEPDTVKSNVKWAPVSTIVPSTSSPTEKLPSIIINPTTPITPSVDLSSQISAGFGLEDTTSQLDIDIYQFVQLCNEIAFGFWKSITGSLNSSRSLIVSPFAATSLLAMVFLGARGATSGEMNEILKLDDMVTFNPHLIFRNVTESIEVSKRAGVAASAIVRQLYSDKNRGKLLSFYKERARQFYDGHVEEANFKEIGDVIRRRTNLLVKRNTWGKIHEFIKENSVTVRPPLAGVSVNIFQTDCSAASTTNRDGEIYFQVSPTIRQRRLVPIPAAVWRSGFLAGYEPGLDATAVAIGAKDQVISTIFVMPGQQGIAAPGDGLARLEQHLVEGAFKEGSWIRLLKSLIPRIGLEVQIPRFSHKSFVNATLALQKMGLKDLFDSKKADLRGLNGISHELYLSDIVQINNFATCGESRIDESHHIEIYPSINGARSTKKLRSSIVEDGNDQRDYQRAFDETILDAGYLSMPLPLRPRQARVPEVPKLRFDRPFLYFVRHNPTGLIMHMGRFNPRLLP